MATKGGQNIRVNNDYNVTDSYVFICTWFYSQSENIINYQLRINNSYIIKVVWNIHKHMCHLYYKYQRTKTIITY